VALGQFDAVDFEQVHLAHRLKGCTHYSTQSDDLMQNFMFCAREIFANFVNRTEITYTWKCESLA